MIPESPVTDLRGVGDKRAKALQKLGIATVGDLIRHLPRAYQDRGRITSVSAAGQSDEPVAMILTVSAEPTLATLKNRMTILKFRAFDETGTVSVAYFNQPFLRDTFRIGATFRFFGKVENFKGRISLTNPIYEPCPDGDQSGLRSIVPIYPLTAGISQKAMSGMISDALDRLHDIPDMLPPEVILENSLCSETFAVRSIHFPDDTASLETARRRLIFDELFITAAAVSVRRVHRRMSGAAAMKDSDVTPVTNALPYELTGAQKRSVCEIAADLAKSAPMKRILCGDVGSGKTAVAAAAAYIALSHGHQAAIMAPTEILAKQHYAFFRPLIEKLGYRCELLCGSLKASEKTAVTKALAASGDDRVDLVIGTHALLTDKVHFADLALVITDEQHRFGVMQRAALEEKSKSAHTLVMSATPIPRTLTLAKYGDLDVSRLDEMPAGRKKISTFAVDSSYRERLTGFIEKQAKEGHQVYVVCPAIDEKPKKDDDPEEMANLTFFEKPESLPILSAAECTEMLKKSLPQVRIGCVHGRMKASERDPIMDAFTSGELDVLVATTVIEVGINVPTATLMVIENAERFGLSQLHQLRGRVGRGDAKSWCILVSDTKSDVSRARLTIMEKSNDGFAIAEEDLRLRGPGDFIGAGSTIRQSGNFETPLAAQCSDEMLIAAAGDSAARLIAADPDLVEDKHYRIARRVERLLGSAANTVN